MRRLRQYHQYLGVFFAPMILLFAVSGALQTFRLQETKGYGGAPPGWIVWLASVHKDQMQPRVRAGGGKEAADRPKVTPARVSAEASRPAETRPNTLPLKVFVALLALALIGSTLLGVTIALYNRVARRIVTVLLVAGTVLPIVLLKL